MHHDCCLMATGRGGSGLAGTTSTVVLRIREGGSTRILSWVSINSIKSQRNTPLSHFVFPQSPPSCASPIRARFRSPFSEVRVVIFCSDHVSWPCLRKRRNNVYARMWPTRQYPLTPTLLPHGADPRPVQVLTSELGNGEHLSRIWHFVQHNREGKDPPAESPTSYRATGLYFPGLETKPWWDR